MTRPLNLIDARDYALLAEIVYSSELVVGPFVDAGAAKAQGWILQALVKGVPPDIGRKPAYADASARVLQDRYGEIVKTRRSGKQEGADMCLVRDRRSGRYMLTVDGTALSGGSPGEFWHDLCANLANFISVTGEPLGALKQQIDAVNGFLEDFAEHEAGAQGKSRDDVAALVDLNGHSLGALVAIGVKRMRDAARRPVGNVIGWSPPGEGGLITDVPVFGFVYGHYLLDAGGITILTTLFDIAKLGGGRPDSSVVELGNVHKDAIESHMIYRHTPMLEGALADYEGFVNALPLSAAVRKAALAKPLLFPSTRVQMKPGQGIYPEGVAYLPLSDGRHVYVSRDGGSLVQGGVITLSRAQYQTCLSTGKMDHVPPVMRKLVLDHGAIPAGSDIPPCKHNVVVRGDGFALSYQNFSDFRHARLRIGKPVMPGKNAPRLLVIALTDSLPLDVLDI